MNEIIESLIQTELQKAESKFKPINSSHEGYSIIKEEVEELEYELTQIKSCNDYLWQSIKVNNTEEQREFVDYIYKHSINTIKEAIQVATMAKRYIKDLKL